MKAISLWQPWASAIAHGSKKFETRSWRYPQALEGQVIAIHSSKRLLTRAELEPLNRICAEWGQPALWGGMYDKLPRGGIVAIARLTRCIPVEESGLDRCRCHKCGSDAPIASWGLDCMACDGGWMRVSMESALGDYSPGRFAWELQDVLRLGKPIPCAGNRKFFNLPPDISEELEDMVTITQMADLHIENLP